MFLVFDLPQAVFYRNTALQAERLFETQWSMESDIE